MASLTRWTWVWVNSGSWWWTGKPGVLWFMGSQRVGHNWATELNWTQLSDWTTTFIYYFWSFGHTEQHAGWFLDQDWTWASTVKALNPNHLATREFSHLPLLIDLNIFLKNQITRSINFLWFDFLGRLFSDPGFQSKLNLWTIQIKAIKSERWWIGKTDLWGQSSLGIPALTLLLRSAWGCCFSDPDYDWSPQMSYVYK